ncbi:universal stress protein [Streptomyces sp. NPDC004629]|uniref:universal stress protein n=1 Tax=Streptomyces sp. NPDC004629 TaxID=3364705 RepID=UPI00369D085D
MARTIAVGVDGSPGSLAAADWAAREAERRDIPLRLVHALRRPSFRHVSPGGTRTPSARHEWPSGTADRLLSEAAARIACHHPDLTISTDRVPAEPVSALLTAAEDADLVVLGTHGPRGGVASALAGSVAHALVARSRRPVILVRDGRLQGEHQSGALGSAAETPAVRDVVLGLDATHPHDAVIEFAFDAALCRAASLRIVHGWSAASHSHGRSGPADGGQPAEPAAATGGPTLSAVLDRWRSRYPGVEVVEQAVIGRAGSHLSEASQDASLVVIGRTPRRLPVGAAIGPVARALLEHSTAPVAVVPHD